MIAQHIVSADGLMAMVLGRICKQKFVRSAGATAAVMHILSSSTHSRWRDTMLMPALTRVAQLMSVNNDYSYTGEYTKQVLRLAVGEAVAARPRPFLSRPY